MRQGDPLKFFIHYVANHQKIEGDPSGFFSKKGLNAEKTERGPFSVARYCLLRGKKGKTFIVQFPGPAGTIL